MYGRGVDVESERKCVLMRQYRAAKRELIARCDGKCECCGGPGLFPHHILPVGKTGINDIMAVDPANLILVCSYCHTLMHPGVRHYLWKNAQITRGNLMR